MEGDRSEQLERLPAVKQPWLAVLLSDLLPGAGQIYGGKRSRGLLFIAAFLFLSAIMASGCYGFFSFEDITLARFCGGIAAGALLVLSAVSLYALFDAYNVTNRCDARRDMSAPVTAGKKPWLGVFLSNLIPGLGQWYVGRKMKGFAFLIFAVLLFSAEERHALAFPMRVLLYFLSMQDAFDTAARINGARDRFFGQERPLLAFIFIMTALHAVPYGDIVRSNIAQAYVIPSGSMSPTLKIGDRILVDQSREARNSVRRGDVIVFKYPGHSERNYIKRAIGMEGDKVQIIDDMLYINERRVATTPVDYVPEPGQRPVAAYDKVLYYEEYLDRTSYRIQLRYDRAQSDAGPWVVPAGSLFVLGDNRDNSQDSRFFGFVPKGNVEGKAVKIFWSWDAATSRVLWGRIGQRIH